MSWEISSDEQYPCPCGRSTYRNVIRSDDWNRYEERVTMNCPECKEKYIQHFYIKSDGEERWYWKEKGEE